MIELNKFMKYKIDDKSSYKLLNITILKKEMSNDEKKEIIEFMQKLINNSDIKYKILIDFSNITNIDHNDVTNILYLYEEKYKMIIDNNIIQIIAIIPNIIISNAVKFFLYFNDLGISIKIVEDIDDVNNILDD